MPREDDWQPRCPHAEKVAGATPAGAGVVCGVMRDDQNRADPILEGAPVGVFISVAEDPSTLANLCCGQGAPVTSPDELPTRAFGQGHYSGCPIFAAAQEIRAHERLYAPEAPPEVDPEMPGVTFAGEEVVSAEELAELGLR